MAFWTKQQEKPRVEPNIQPTTKALPTEPNIDISFFPGWSGGVTASGVTVTRYTVMQLAAGYACVNMITSDISKLPLRVQKADSSGWKKVNNTNLTRLFRKPNKRTGLSGLLSVVVFNYLVHGNGYIVVIRDSAGNPVKLIPVDDSSVTVNEQINGDRVYYVNSKMLLDEKTSISSEEGFLRIIREEDMIHIQNLSFNGNLTGESPTSMASEVFGAALAAQEVQARAYQNGSFFSGILKTAEKMNPTAINKIMDIWNRAHQSVTNSGRTPLLSNGVEYQEVGSSAVDMQLLEAQERFDQNICRMFKVPGQKLGYDNHEKASSLEQQERSYISSALKPITCQLEEQMALKLLFDDQIEEYRFVFDFTEMTIPDQNERGQYYAIALTNGFMNQDEVREQEGRSPLPNGEGQEFVRPVYTANQDGTGSHRITEDE